MRKKIISILTSTVCTVSMLSAGLTQASAELSEPTLPLPGPVTPGYVKYYTYESFAYVECDSDGDGTNDSIRITNCASEEEYLEIPEKINDMPVKYIGVLNIDYDIVIDFFANSTKVKSIKIPDSVVEINNGAFSHCTALEEIVLSKNLKTIENGLFYGCSSLKSIVIPDSVTSINTYAFADCTSLSEINIPDSVTKIEADAFVNTAILNNQAGVKYIDKWVVSCDKDSELSECVIKEGTVGIADSAFYNCSGIKSIVIPDSAKYLGALAFYQMQNVENIVIGKGIDCIPRNCFYKCISLNKVTIPDSVKSIDVNAFSDCTSLTSITLPDSITDIGSRAFQNCTNLEIIILPKNMTELKNIFFNCTSLKTVELPENLTNIKQNAFSGCKSLENIDIPDSVVCIEEYAFEDTALLNNQTDKVKYADDWLIECDDTATECTIKETTKGIAMYAFANCTELKSIVIPNSVEILNASAFARCLSLETVIIGNGLKKIEAETFERCMELKNIIIPDTVTSIGNQAFERCSKLVSIKLPDSIKEIGEFAFNNCKSLESIVIPQNCQVINCGAFSCESLNKITILNPDCEIYDAEDTISNTFSDELNRIVYNGTIYGYANSTAQAYAEKYNYKFSVLENAVLPIIYGDITGNGRVTESDLRLLQMYLVKKSTLKADAFVRADMNQDGKVNIFDSILLKRKIMNTNIYLESDKKEFSTSEENTLTYFYANVSAENDVTVKLYNALTDQPIMEMVDDGKYSISGDDLVDGVYSCKFEVDNSEAKDFYYYAKIEETGEKSDFCTVTVYKPFSDQDLKDIQTVDSAIENLCSSSDFWKLSESERKAKCDELFIKLISDGLVVNISYDEKSKSYKYTYKCGMDGSLSLKPYVVPSYAVNTMS